MPICPTCNSEMHKVNGPFGEFWGCSQYRNCTTTVSLSDVDEKFDIPTGYHDGESYGICDRCQNEDTLSEMNFCSKCQYDYEKD